MSEPRLALYWQCWLCGDAFSLYEPRDAFYTQCSACKGRYCLMPTYGPTDPEDDYIPTAWSP